MGTQIRSTGLLMIAFCLGVAALAWPAPPTAELAPPTVMVANAAGETGEALVPVVKQTLSTRAAEMPQARASVAQPWELAAEITKTDVGGEKARVVVVAELTPPDKKVRYVAQATGEAAGMEEAAAEAAETVIEELGVCLTAKGTVYQVDDKRWEAWVTIGSRDGLRPKAQVAFIRWGEIVAIGEAVTVKNVDAIVKPDRDTPGGTVMLGDDVFILRNGPRSAVDSVTASEKRQRALRAFLALAVLAGSIAAAR